MLQANQTPTAGPSQRVIESKQPRRLFLALLLLLVALGGVIIKDRQFWFGSNDAGDLEATEPEVARQTVAKSIPSVAQHTPAAHTSAVKKQIPAARNSIAKAADAPAVTAMRTVLPPMDVEVVAGDNHRTLHPNSNSTKVELTTPASAERSSSSLTAATNASEHERLAIDATPSYPLLGQHMNVQGSVVLQAVIGTDGIIQNLRVLSGPGILTPAAQQAVREWRFKPIIQNGQAVESQARITVNFSIKIADGNAKTTLAESRPLTIETLTR